MPIFTGIATAIFAGTALAGTWVVGATAFALQMAAGIGLNLIAAAIQGKKNQYTGIQGKLGSGGDTPRSFILGTYNTAGSLVYNNTYHQASDTPNALYAAVVALSDVPVQSITEYWLDGQKLDVRAATNQYGNYSNDHISNGDQHLWFRFYDGTQTAADSELVNGLSTSARPYGADRVGYGVAYVILTALMDRRDNDNPMFKGLPQAKYTVKGLKLYDPSRDSTVGGDGSQRYSDQSTWGGDGDDLPVVQIYNILRGIRYSGQWVYGLQASNPAVLPPENWIAAINKCRSLVDGASGSEAQYRSAAQVNVDVDPADLIDTLLKTCAGRISEVGGVYTIHVGEPDSPAVSFSDDDILSTEEQVANPFRALADSLNGAVAKYPEPAEGWNIKTSPPFKNPAQQVRDGNRELLADVDLSACPYAGQVQRLLKSEVLEALRERRHVIVLPPWAQCLEPGDVVSWTSARNGYEAKWFRIDGLAYKADLNVMLQQTEVDPSDYDWHQETDYTAPVYAPMQIIRPAPQPIVSWDAEGFTEYDDIGLPRRPGILLTWDGSKSDLRGVSYEIATAADDTTIIIREQTDDADRGSIKVFSQAYIAGATYYARGRYIPMSPRDTPFSDWRPATLPDVRLTAADLNAIINNKITTAMSDITKVLKDTRDFLDTVTADDVAQNWLDKDSTQSQLTAVNGSLSASIKIVQTVAVSTSEALAAYQILINAKTDATNASLSQESLTRASADSALSSQINTVSTTVDGHTAELTTVQSSVDGISVQYGVVGTIDGVSGAFIFSGVKKLDGTVSYNVAINGGLIVSGTILASAMNVGSLDAISANMGTLTTGTIIISD